MKTPDQTIEQEIQAKGLTAPRVTPADIDANIVNVEIVTHVSQGRQVLRWAVITTKSGYAVVGNPSVAVSPENDDVKIGTKIAFENSKNQLWPLMGYALKERLSDGAPVAKKNPPYTWSDVANYVTFKNNMKSCTEFVIHTKGDNRKYQGAVQYGLTEIEGRQAAILECNRQRDELNA